jgi:tyrosyl-tRNA synthetase
MTKEEVLKLLEPILITKVVGIKKHENADKLWVLKIDAGDHKYDFANEDGTIQIVTGANNFEVGDLVPFLSPGNVVPGWLFTNGESIKLESRAMRGEMSHGMILAEDEIGTGTDHSGILVIEDSNPKFEILSSKEELIGKSLVEVLRKETLEVAMKTAGVIEITPEMQKKIDLIMSITLDGGEIVGEDQLPEILTSGEPLYTYDGFEPSGQMHIAQGIIRAINTNKMIEAGFTFRMWVADWFGYLNNKMGGDMEKIQKVGKYFIEIWKAAGMNLEHTEFLWTSDFVGQREYWETVMKVTKASTLKRILRTTEIMGRSETDDLSAAQILYPAMQITDIFKVMKCQVTQLGLDQRKVNMLAREIGPELGFWKPVIVSHGMLQGLGKPAAKDADAAERAISMKMSKSKPDTAIFMTDTAADVERKINNAYCPETETEDNPILGYCKKIIFESDHLIRKEPVLENGKFVVERDEKFGGNIEFGSYEELEEAYKKGGDSLHPADLKKAVIKYINRILQPVRDHFETDSDAKKLLEEVKSFQITR